MGGFEDDDDDFGLLFGEEGEEGEGEEAAEAGEGVLEEEAGNGKKSYNKCDTQ